jgi:hypothetical protein
MFHHENSKAEVKDRHTMTLIFTGEEQSSIEFRWLEAFDGDKRVMVRVTREAATDYERSLIQSVASDKYDRGQFEADGAVLVKTSDCQQS